MALVHCCPREQYIDDGGGSLIELVIRETMNRPENFIWFDSLRSGCGWRFVGLDHGGDGEIGAGGRELDVGTMARITPQVVFDPAKLGAPVDGLDELPVQGTFDHLMTLHGRIHETPCRASNRTTVRSQV